MADDAEQSALAARAQKFMTGFDSESVKRQQESKEVQLRKTRRTDAAMKRRNLQSQREWVRINEQYKANYSLEDLPELLQAMVSGDDPQLLFAAQGLRKLLSLEQDPPVQPVIDAGVLAYLLDWVQRSDFAQLQYEAAWSITNMTSGAHQHTQAVVEKGAVPLLLKLLESTCEEVREQSVWALGNIGGDSTHCRDLILQTGGMPGLIRCVEQSARPALIKNGIWAISNLCRSKPAPKYAYVQEAVPLLARMLQEHNDVEILSDCLWALSHLSEGSEERVQALLDTQCLPRVIQLLGHHIYNVQLPAIRTVGNVVTGSELQTQCGLNLGAVQGLAALLGSAKRNVRKEAVWALSNVCAGTPTQLEKVLSSDAVSKLVIIAQHDEDEIVKEVVWALSNACAAGAPMQVARLVENGVIQALSVLLQHKEAKVVSVALEGLNRLLKTGQEVFAEGEQNPFALLVEQCGGLNHLEALQVHPNTYIYNKARGVIETYFEVERDDNQDLLDTISQYTTFSF